MAPLNVPMQDSKLILRSFWLVISFVFAGIVSSAGWAFHLPFPWVCGAVLFLLAASLVLVGEKLVRRLYHAWNNRIVSPLSNFGSALVLRICLFVVFTATGRAGSRLRLRGVPGRCGNRMIPSRTTEVRDLSRRARGVGSVII